MTKKEVKEKILSLTTRNAKFGTVPIAKFGINEKKIIR